MKAGTALDEAHQREIESALEKYPFFAMGRMMMAKVATKLGNPRAQQLRFLGALYAPSRQHYAFFLEERLRPRVPPPPRLTPSSRESHIVPPSSEKKEEKPTSGDEPGPAEMPYSEAFWPPLQGWLAAHQILYASLGKRLRSQLADRLSLPPSTSSPTAASKEVPLSTETALPPSPPHRRQAHHILTLTPMGMLPLLQFELQLKEKSKEAKAPETLSALPPAFEPSEAANGGTSPSPPSQAEEPTEVLSTFSAEEKKRESSIPYQEEDSSALQSQFHRRFIPLEEVEKSIHLPTEMREGKAPQAQVESLSAPSELSPDLFTSDSPIRVFIPLEIDVEGSIHLPVPEQKDTNEEEIPLPSSEIVLPPPETKSSPSSWQSFLAELQKELPITEVPAAPVTKELEGLRREFIRRLLARRLLQPHVAPSPQGESLIDKLLRKLESLQPPHSQATEEVPELTIPPLETPSSAPRVYTETMARLYWAQGDLVKAIQVYEVLAERHPENASHYRLQIERIRAGEAP